MLLILPLSLSCLLGLGAIYVTARSFYYLVRAARSAIVGEQFAAAELRVKFLQFGFILACAIVTMFIVMILTGFPFNLLGGM